MQTPSLPTARPGSSRPSPGSLKSSADPGLNPKDRQVPPSGPDQQADQVWGETRFRALIENSTDIIAVVNAEGSILYNSPSVEKYFAARGAVEPGTSAFDYIHEEDIPRLTDIFLDLVQHPGKSVSVQTRAHTKEGREIWVEGMVANLLATQGINGIVCNFRDVTERVRSEMIARESEGLYRGLERQLSEEKLRRQKEIMQATIDAQEKEREDIGRELHDNINQMLTTARLCLECVSGREGEQGQIIERSSNIITTAIEEIRKLSKSMTQSFHKEIGLKLSIEDLADSIGRLAGNLRIVLDFVLPDEQSLDDKLKMTVFRIIQEQLNNVLKHAGASSIRISIRQGAGLLSLRIADDGKGFNTRQKRKGIGINNIINRAELFNGQLKIDSSRGKGCRMSVDFRLATP
jgi:PAS domain S-box-containing protein